MDVDVESEFDRAGTRSKPPPTVGSASLARANNLGVSRSFGANGAGAGRRVANDGGAGFALDLKGETNGGGSSSSIGATPPDDVVRVVGASSSAFGIVPGSGLGVDSRARSGSRSRVVFGRWSSARAAYADARGVVGRFDAAGAGRGNEATGVGASRAGANVGTDEETRAAGAASGGGGGGDARGGGGGGDARGEGEAAARTRERAAAPRLARAAVPPRARLWICSPWRA